MKIRILLLNKSSYIWWYHRINNERMNERTNEVRWLGNNIKLYLFYERTRNEYHHLHCWCPKKSRVSGIFFQQINTENQQQINCWCPKIVPKFSHPYGGQSEILPKFRKVLRKFQQQISSKSTEQSRNSTLFGTSTLQMVIYETNQ